MEIFAVDRVYLISVSTHASEQAALLAKYLPSVLVRSRDWSPLKAHVLALLAGGYLAFLAMFMCCHTISNLL